MRFIALSLLLLLLAALACAEVPAPAAALARMPVKEITVFKDGHTFVLHEGELPTDPAGQVVMDYLPMPVMGTFWPYSTEKGVKLTAVTAGQRMVQKERPVQHLRELLQANIGTEASITEKGVRYTATIMGVFASDAVPQHERVILLKTADGVKPVLLERIEEVQFKGTPKTVQPYEEAQNLLTLKLDWNGQQPAAKAGVGMMYLQKGVRWIPSYSISLNDKGQATVKMQATLINELADLEDVTANLVVGVPSFAFKDTLDPMALQQAVARLSGYFDQDSRTLNSFSNSIMTQSARMTEVRNEANIGPNLSPELDGMEKNDDLFIYTFKHLSIKKGERMVVPVAEFTVPYRDIYTLDLPYAPPREVFQQFNMNQQGELARLLNAPKAQHKIRLTNKSAYPFTTAPALIFNGDRLLGQGMMTYTPVGGISDLTVTTAVDIGVQKKDRELKRTPNAVTWNGDQYSRVDVAGTVTLTNHSAQPVTLEITRQVLGNLETADHGGQVIKIGSFDDDQYLVTPDHPGWWNWYSWPYWWTRFNGTGLAKWTVTLDPGKTTDLGYTWHYFWR